MTTIYEMTWSLSSVLTLNKSVQLKLNSDENWIIKLRQKQARANAKQNGIRCANNAVNQAQYAEKSVTFSKVMNWEQINM